VVQRLHVRRKLAAPLPLWTSQETQSN
jgi:hypothetical protein